MASLEEASGLVGKEEGGALKASSHLRLRSACSLERPASFSYKQISFAEDLKYQRALACVISVSLAILV